VAPTAHEWASHAGLCHTFLVIEFLLLFYCSVLNDSSGLCICCLRYVARIMLTVGTDDSAEVAVFASHHDSDVECEHLCKVLWLKVPFKVASHRIQHSMVRRGAARHGTVPPSPLSHWNFPYALDCTVASHNATRHGCT